MSAENRVDDMLTTAADFMCEVVGVDGARFELAKQWGDIVYVRVMRGALPPPLLNVLVRSEGRGRYRTLFGRPHKGEGVSMKATLIMVSRRAYRLTLLAALPALDVMRPHLRDGLQPPEHLDPATVPVALSDLSAWCRPYVDTFRPHGGQLVSGWDPPGSGIQIQPEGMPWDRMRAIQELGRQGRHSGGEQVIAPLMVALQDEIGSVRSAAAQALLPLAAQLSVDSFLDLACDTSALNEPACLVAARVFGTHPDVVPLERVIALFRNAPSSRVAEMAVWALGQHGERAPIEILANCLRSFFLPGPHEFPLMSVQSVRWEAARVLRALGDRAPIDALIAGLADDWSAKDAAQALLAHSGPVPEEALRAAERVMRGEVASARIPPTP